MVFVSVLIAPVVMAAATATERRLGPSAGGRVAALPLGFAVALAAVAIDAGGASASAMALSAASHVPAQVLFAAAFATAVTRSGAALAGAAGVLAYVAGAVLLALLPDAVAVAVSVPLLALAPRMVTASPPRQGTPKPWSTTVATCAVPALIVAVAVLATRLAGPVAAGAVAAFPTVSATLAIAVTKSDGGAAGAHVLGGMIRSLPVYLAFCLLVAVQ